MFSLRQRVENTLRYRYETQLRQLGPGVGPGQSGYRAAEAAAYPLAGPRAAIDETALLIQSTLGLRGARILDY